MIKVGITGGIGSGKSTVCRIFELFGVPVYHADEEGRKILDTDESVKKNIVKLLGNEVLNKAGKLDRKKISAIVFNNNEKLEQLNSIVHPAVGIGFTNWLKQHQSAKYILKEVAILFESESYKQVDKAITVVAPLELRIKRAIKRDIISREQVEQRMKHQMGDEEKIKRSQFVIHNDEEHLLIPQIITIHEQLMN